MENKIIELIKLNFDLDDFYSISIRKNQISLQGNIVDQNIIKYTKKGYVFDFKNDRYIANNNGIEIIFI